MKTTIYGQNERVCQWVGPRVDEPDFGPWATTIGVEQDGELVAGAVYHVYRGHSINMHLAAVPGRRWLTRDALWKAFAYPFIQLGCVRITAFIRADNFDSQRFAEHAGFRKEGLMRKACADGTDMIVYGMLREECRWIGAKDGAVAHN
jgi:RimJ/RimL family protein N-acetyltransferase